MNCEKHPKYKGLTKLGKRNKDCPACNRLYLAVQQEKKDRIEKERIYNSLSTPGLKCDLAHVLAETITIMRFGLQAERFWTESSSTNSEIKKYFISTLTLARRWINTKFLASNSLKAFLYMSFVQHELKQDMSNIKVETTQENAIDNTPGKDVISSLGDLKPKRNIIDFINSGD